MNDALVQLIEDYGQEKWSEGYSAGQYSDAAGERASRQEAERLLSEIRAALSAPSPAGEAVAYLHTLHMSDGDKLTELHKSDDPERCFGRRGRDYGEEYGVTVQPLFLHPAPPASPAESGAVPDGYKLVPIDPTPEMDAAGTKALCDAGVDEVYVTHDGEPGDAVKCYRAMIGASLVGCRGMLKEAAKQLRLNGEHGHAAMCEAHAAAAVEEVAPVAWVRLRPDGELAGELLLDQCIEPARKSSGAWMPLYAASVKGAKG
jgi:hypothetical protein